MNSEFGKITKQEDGYCVVFERTLNHDIHTVWDAITNPEKLKFWFTDFIMDFKPGGKISVLNRDEYKTASHGEIVKIDEPSCFSYIWEGDLAVWELSPLGDTQCRLKLTYSRIDKEYVGKTPAGWHLLLDRLVAMLAGSNQTYPFGLEDDNPKLLELIDLYSSKAAEQFQEL